MKLQAQDHPLGGGKIELKNQRRVVPGSEEKQKNLQASGRQEERQESMIVPGKEKDRKVSERVEEEHDGMTTSCKEGEGKEKSIQVFDSMEEEESMPRSCWEEEKSQENMQVSSGRQDEEQESMEDTVMREEKLQRKSDRDMEETVTLDELSLEHHGETTDLDQSWVPPLACSTPKRGVAEEQEEQESMGQVEEGGIGEGQEDSEPDQDLEETVTVDEESDHVFVRCLHDPHFWDMMVVCQVQSD